MVRGLLEQGCAWIQHVIAFLLGVFGLLTRQDFLVNFVANLGGALCGVLLAFWIEHRRTRRDATNLYGRLLSTSRSELAYLRPMCMKVKDGFRAAKLVTPLGSLSAPATRALLVNPLVQEKAPYSLIMALTILSAAVDATEDALRHAKTLISGKLGPEMAATYGKALGDEMEQLERLMMIVLERLDLELGRLGIKVTVDPETQEVSRRLLEVLQKRSENS